MKHSNTNDLNNHDESLKRLAKERSEQFKKEALSIEDQVIEEFNKKYAVVHSSSTYILIEKKNKVIFDKKNSLEVLHSNDFFIPSGDSKKPIKKFPFWMNHPNRRTYKEGIVFDPTRQGHYGNQYNLFKGHTVLPKQGNCNLYWEHVYCNICNGNDAHYNYVRKWMASIIQKPKVLGTALVLRGKQGTGKNVFVEHFGKLFGQHFLTLTSLDQVCGKFNAHLQYAYLIFANEALWDGSKKEVGALKALITDPTIFIEAKGKDGFQIDNYRHLIICSNEDSAVPIDWDDRRFFCLNVSSEHKEDGAYFGKVVYQLKQGGYEALLYDLQNEDLSNFDPRDMPLNDSGFDMKKKSGSSADIFVFEMLKHGAQNFILDESVWKFESEIRTKEIQKNYRDFCDEEGLKREDKSVLGKSIKKFIPSVYSKKGTTRADRGNRYYFPSLDKCRKEFEIATKSTSKVWEEDV
ncbi:MAG: hypothetical protein COT84_08475 [Chlamydiae bacterium CG10_big_fil_rev_8_21_14_0_10_35_9]|nr:MAG: hypothetical protein COT84_08475 [Chlamydiae bacterium CG10_big_fil_rev_8_21_14_0_10_35_9]